MVRPWWIGERGKEGAGYLSGLCLPAAAGSSVTLWARSSVIGARRRLDSGVNRRRSGHEAAVRLGWGRRGAGSAPSLGGGGFGSWNGITDGPGGAKVTSKPHSTSLKWYISFLKISIIFWTKNYSFALLDGLARLRGCLERRNWKHKNDRKSRNGKELW